MDNCTFPCYKLNNHMTMCNCTEKEYCVVKEEIKKLKKINHRNVKISKIINKIKQ